MQGVAIDGALHVEAHNYDKQDEKERKKIKDKSKYHGDAPVVVAQVHLHVVGRVEKEVAQVGLQPPLGQHASQVWRFIFWPQVVQETII